MDNPIEKIQSIMDSDGDSHQDSYSPHSEFTINYDFSPEKVRSEVATMIEKGEITEEDYEGSADDFLEYVGEVATDLKNITPKIKNYPTIAGGYTENITKIQEKQSEWIEENATPEMVETVDEVSSVIPPLLLYSQGLFDKSRDDFTDKELGYLRSEYPEIYNLWKMIPYTMPERAEESS